MTLHNNISIFVAHVGCPNVCSFCNQHTISGSQKAPTTLEVDAICKEAFQRIKDKSNTEIAFFGGSFTAIEPTYMLSLLQVVQKYIGNGGFYGIRVSTRPDCISKEVLEVLKQYHVTSIELGCQSMCDDVLTANRRGHTAKDVYHACDLIRQYDFELGLQMMVGLYKSTIQDEYYTANQIVSLKPDTVRIYPVCVLKGTELADLYLKGEYTLYDMDTIVDVCCNLLLKFDSNSIRVIKCGLHASEMVETDLVAGYYHPAFRELCESRIYRKNIQSIIGLNPNLKHYVIVVSDRYISMAKGQKKSNIQYFKDMGISVSIKGSQGLNKYETNLEVE